MPTVKHIERTIYRIEGFNVQITTQDGRDIRSDMDLPNSYHYQLAAKDNYTVQEWKNRGANYD